MLHSVCSLKLALTAIIVMGRTEGDPVTVLCEFMVIICHNVNHVELSYCLYDLREGPKVTLAIIHCVLSVDA